MAAAPACWRRVVIATVHMGRCVWSAAVNLFEVVTLVAVALFLLVGVVVAALRPAPLLGLLLGRLRPSARLSALATGVSLRTEVCATGGHVTAAAPPALSLRLGLLRRSGFDCPVTLFVQRRGKVERGEKGEESFGNRGATVDHQDVARVERETGMEE